MNKLLLCFHCSFSFWLVVTQAVAQNQAVLIGYTDCQAVTNFTQATMNRIAQFNWFFAHASVGACILDGLTSLHQTHSSFYPLQSVAATGTPPGSNEPSTIYQYARGNPSWQAKIDDFQTYVSNGWHFPRVKFALNKLCYIDPAADLSYYIGSMTNLELAFPQTVFVYATIPLTTNADSDNYTRNLYNDDLRTWCRTNNRVLFDLADIQAHDTNGTLCTFTYNQRVCQMLYSGYSSDGGHPNSTEAEQLLARGFYALTAAVSAPPASQTNVIVGIRTNPNGTFTLTFRGTPQAQYSVLTQTNLAEPMPHWMVLAGSTTTVTNSEGLWWFTVTNMSQQQFYRSAALNPSP